MHEWTGEGICYKHEKSERISVLQRLVRLVARLCSRCRKSRGFQFVSSARVEVLFIGWRLERLFLRVVTGD